MEKLEIEKEIESIDGQINTLKKQKASLEEMYKTLPTTSFADRFRMWAYNNEEKATIGDLFELKSYPESYKLIKEGDIDRYRVIDFLEYYNEDFDVFLDPDCYDDDYMLKHKKDIERFEKIGQEMMDGDFDSVEYDW